MREKFFDIPDCRKDEISIFVLMLFTKVHRQMRIVFDGPQSIDANTLVNVLIHYTNVVKMVSEEYDGGAHRVSINVDAPKRGSFIIDMSLVDKFKGVFSGENVAWMAGIVTIVGGAYKAYKIMRGRKAETEEDKKRITVNAPTSIRNCIINVYNRPETRQAISKSMETVRDDGSVEALRILDDEGGGVVFDRDEFPDMVYDGFADEEDSPSERTVDEDARLVITALSFDKGGKWKFIYRGNPIIATIKDDDLMGIISKGERFGKGDALHVTLRVKQRYDPEIRCYVNAAYSIVKFHEHIVREAETGDIFNQN